MSIWKAAARPVGFAYQNNKGPGINITPIDPRAFGVNSGNGRSSGTQRSGRNESDEKYDAQSGTRKSITEFESVINMQKSLIEQEAIDNITNAKTQEEVNKFQDDYKAKLGQIYQEEMNLGVVKQNAKFSHDNQTAIDKKIYDKGINTEIGIESNDLAKVNNGTDLLYLFRKGTPFSYDSEKGLLTYEERQRLVNERSGIYRDKNGSIKSSEYMAPSLKIKNSSEADTEVRGIIKDAQTEKSERAYDDPNLMMRIDRSYESNINNLNRAVNSLWQSTSEDTRNYALSSAMSNGIYYDTGEITIEKKDGKTIKKKVFNALSGDSAIARIETLMAEAEKLPKEDAERAKKLKQAQAISDGIVNTAKDYLLAMGKGDVAGLQKVIDSYKTTDDKEARKAQREKEEQEKALTAIDTIYTKVQDSGTTQLYLTNPNTGQPYIVKNVPSKTYLMSPDETNAISDKLFQIKDGDKQPIPMSSVGTVVINGIPVSAGALFNDNAKVVSITSELRTLPKYNTTPEPNGYILYKPVKQISPTELDSEMYVTGRTFVTRDQPIPYLDATGKPAKRRVDELSDQIKKQLKLKEVKGGYEIDAFVRAPATNATNEGNNTPNAYNRKLAYDNSDRANVNDRMDRLVEYNIADFERKQIEERMNVLQTLRKKDPSITFVDENGYAYRGKTPEEKLESIIDVNNTKGNDNVTKRVLYKLMYQRAITNDEYNKMIDLVDEKDLEYKLKMRVVDNALK